METWYVKSDVNCPLCGEKMKLMSGSVYYNHDLGLVNLYCDDCNLDIREYGHHHGFGDGEANSYWPLTKTLLNRVKGGTK